MKNQRAIAVFYLILAGVGLVTAWYFNTAAILNQENLLTAWFTTNADLVLAFDLFIVAFAVAPFILIEGKRLKMKNRWLYIALSAVTAVAFTFPLFMAMRAFKLQKIALAGGRIETHTIHKHRVDVWVPGDLNPQTPVLVMHDGKNLFMPEHSTFGATWGLLDALRPDERGYRRIRGDRTPMIIGVWQIDDSTRINELGPQKLVDEHPEILDMLPPGMQPASRVMLSDAYQAMIVEEILPFLAKRHSLKLDPSRTAIAGSSMGGLASLYGLAKYPEVYGTALAYSTHWPFGMQLAIDGISEMLPAPGKNRIWTDCGTIELDALYPSMHEKFVALMRAKGYTSDEQFIGAIYPNTGHSETWWAGRVEHPINWWLNPNEPKSNLSDREWVGLPQ
jgi:predicted alpha/beta superfamily hydrolase